VPFYVKDQGAFRRSYPPGSRDRCARAPAPDAPATRARARARHWRRRALKTGPHDLAFAIPVLHAARSSHTGRQKKLLRSSRGAALSGCRRAARRLRLEGEVEVAYKQRLEQLCYNERLAQQKLYRWGQAQRARAMELPNCAELNTRFGHRMPFYSY